MQRYRIKRTVQPTLEPITVAEALLHCRCDSNNEEAWFESTIATARHWIEDRCNMTLLTTTWQLTLDRFPCRTTASAYDRDRIELPRCPVQSVSSIAYVDEDGTTQTFAAASYSLDNAGDTDASVGPIYDGEWPDVRDQRNAVTVTYIAGYTLPGNVPPQFRHAIKLLVGHWYENREASLVGTISKEIEFSVLALVDPSNLSTLG